MLTYVSGSIGQMLVNNIIVIIESVQAKF